MQDILLASSLGPPRRGDFRVEAFPAMNAGSGVYVPSWPDKQREHGGGLGEILYVAERTLAWFGHNRRLKLFYEKIREHFQAFHDLAAALSCAHKLSQAA